MRLYSKVALGLLVVTTAAIAAVVYAAPGGVALLADTQGGAPAGRGGERAAELAVAEAVLPVSTLPGGASSLSEAYQDWQVSCAMSAAVQNCLFSQNQTQSDGRRVLGVELGAPSGEVVNGLLVLPFGLALDSGVTVQVDDTPVGQPLRFRTCLPAGCVVPLRFDATTLTMLRAGAKLQIGAVVDGGGGVPFTISLSGFAAALDRVAALSPTF